MNIGLLSGIILAIIIAVIIAIYILISIKNKKKRVTKSILKNKLVAFWIAPAFLLLIIFIIYPVINTFLLSFFNANSTEFIGFENYQYIFTDSGMLNALGNNLLWLVFFTLITVTIGLVLAVLTDRIKYESVAKSIIFLPAAISFVAAGIIWKFVYAYNPKGETQIGLLNAVLTFVGKVTNPENGFEPQAWLFNPEFNNWALIIVGVWMWTGFVLIIFSASLKGIPKALLDAARIDGANEITIFFKIIIPHMASTITVVVTYLVINVLKIFDIIYIMTNGNLGTEVIANRMYKEMFSFRNFGRASAIAAFLLIVVIPVVAFNIKRFSQKGGN